MKEMRQQMQTQGQSELQEQGRQDMAQGQQPPVNM
jgi:hypothetical protein